MVRKIGMDQDESWRKVEIQCHYNSSKNVQDNSMVSVKYRQESITIHDDNTTVNED